MLWKDCLALSRHKWNILIQFRSREKNTEEKKGRNKERHIIRTHTETNIYLCLLCKCMCSFVHVCVCARASAFLSCVCVCFSVWVHMCTFTSNDKQRQEIIMIFKIVNCAQRLLFQEDIPYFLVYISVSFGISTFLKVVFKILFWINYIILHQHLTTIKYIHIYSLYFSSMRFLSDCEDARQWPGG